MLLIDAHLDLSLNAVNWNRDLTRTVAEIRRSEIGMPGQGRAANTVALPDMRRGEVAICFATVLARANPKGTTNIDFRNQEIACAMARGQLAYYEILEAAGQLRQLRTKQDVDSHLTEWRRDPIHCPLAYVLSMEGADPVLSPAHVGEWWELGLRAVGISHFGVSAYAHGTGTPGGLTARGPDLLRAIRETGMILDVTHLADDAFWQALEIFDGPVWASHNNCRHLVPGDRQFSDEQLRALIERDAVIGAVLDIWMLYPPFETGVTPNTVSTLEDVVDHIDRVCQLAGNARHAAIGSDLDGEFGTEQTPHDVDTIADLQKIPAILRRRGYSEEDVNGIMHGNWLRMLRRGLPGDL
jgi:membrane dipeptidase